MSGMKIFILLVFLALLSECKQVQENVVDRDNSDDESAGEPTQKRESSYGSHPYLEGDFYEDIAGLDMTAKSYSGPDLASISVIEANTSSCVKSGGAIGLKFQLPLASLERDITYSELVIELENSEDAVSLLSSYVLMEGEENREPKTGQPRVRSSWLIYDVNDILKAFKGAYQRSETVTLSVRLVAAPLNRNATGSGAEFDACRFYSRRLPTMFLYHDFPKELRQHLLRGSEAGRTRVRRSLAPLPPPLDGETCHLHKLIVNASQMGMDWIITPALFELHYCHGHCSRLRFFWDKEPDKQLCCVPTSYRSLNMIYREVGGRIVYSEIPKMTATWCRCR